jgi:hypothetical protein
MIGIILIGQNTVKPEHGGINSDKSRDAVRYANRAPTVFRGLAKGAFALAGLAVAALPTLSVNGKVSSLAALIIVSAALFLGLVGFVFQLQAHIFEIEDTK